MARLLLRFVLLAVVVSCDAATAVAQFGSIFGDPPPRPPVSVPERAPPPDQPVPSNLPPPDRSRDAIRSQPLPPPPGASAIEPDAPAQTAPTRPGQRMLPGLPPDQRQPRGLPRPADISPQPDDEVVAGPPAEKIVNPGALFSGLDKITGRIIKFDVAIGETVQFGALQVTPRACYSRPPTETPNTDAFVEVDEVTLQGDVRRIFTGWIFAASPGLHAVEHPIYDIWLTDCKKEAVAGVQSKEADPQTPAETPRPSPGVPTPPRRR